MFSLHDHGAIKTGFTIMLKRTADSNVFANFHYHSLCCGGPVETLETLIISIMEWWLQREGEGRLRPASNSPYGYQIK